MTKRGFSLVEILVVVSLMGIIVSLGLAGWTNYRDWKTLEGAGQEIVTQLRLIRSKALLGEKPSNSDCQALEGYSVQVETISGSNEITAIPVCDGSDQFTDNRKIIEFNSEVVFSLSSSFRFNSLSGRINKTSAIEISLSYHGKEGKVIISQQGSSIRWEKTV